MHMQKNEKAIEILTQEVNTLNSDELHELFLFYYKINYQHFNLTTFENFNEFDTGFESRFLDGYKMEVKNKFTGYTLVFDVKDQYGSYIDANGGPPDGSIRLDPFYVFEPTDTDNDGNSEIFCKQYTSYPSHADYTGMACSVLKFNKQAQVFEVIDAWYEPNTEPNTEQ